MAERAAVLTRVQVGVEVTPGTPVATTKILQATSIDTAIKTKVNTFTPYGTKYPTVAAQAQEWIEGKVKGIASYTELTYLLSSLLTSTTPTLAGTTAHLWTFDPASQSADTPVTFTVEQGDATHAHKFAYGLVTDLNLKFDRAKGIDVSGTIIGQMISDAITLTAGATPVAEVPILPTQVSVKLADTQAGLAAALALGRPLSLEWDMTGRYKPVWPFNAVDPSFVAHVEDAPKLLAKVLVEADTEGMGPLTNLRSGATKWLRIAAIGAQIETGQNYMLQIDMATKVTDVSEFKDQDGLYALEWTFTGVHDATWGKALEVQLENLLAAL